MGTSVPPSTDVVKLDLSIGSLQTVLVDGEPYVVLRPAIESIGLSYSRQLKKLKTRSWAVVAQRATTGSDGKTYKMDVVSERTFLMLLATVNERGVSEELRPTLIAFQRETADAIASYWLDGGAINPRATPAQAEELQQRIADLEPDADAWKTLASGQLNYSVRTVAAILKQDTGITITERQIFQLLKLWGWTYGRHEPYARVARYAVKRMYSDYQDRETREIRSGGWQLRITVDGVAAIRRRLHGVAAIADII